MGNSSRKSISGLVPAPPDEPRPEDPPKGPTSRSSCPQFVPYSDDDDDGQDEDEEEEFFDASDSLPPPTQVLCILKIQSQCFAMHLWNIQVANMLTFFMSWTVVSSFKNIVRLIFVLGRDGILIHSTS